MQNNKECECYYGIQEWPHFLYKVKMGHRLYMTYDPKSNEYGLYYFHNKHLDEASCMLKKINYCPYCGRNLHEWDE